MPVPSTRRKHKSSPAGIFDSPLLKSLYTVGSTGLLVGWTRGIHAEGALLQTNLIQGNTLTMDSGDGMLIVTSATGGSGSVITGNTISGSGAHGIYVNARGAPKAGGSIIASNTITGFGTPLLVR